MGHLTEFMPISRSLYKTYASQGYTCRLIAATWETSYLASKLPSRPDMVVSMGSNGFGALGGGTKQVMATPAVVSLDDLTTLPIPVSPLSSSLLQDLVMLYFMCKPFSMMSIRSLAVVRSDMAN
ncbi:hypothetical protein BDR03DRAFT_255170 [Suillus americanus]|nr:hypothetical protein BDR03DRAFT_255170 [Suillus americanus]